MKHIRELESKWQIRFKDASRQPQEVSFSFDKDVFTRRDIQQLRDDLRYAWQRGEWNPWTGRLPGEGDGEATPSLTVEEAVKAYIQHKRQLGERGQEGGWNEKTERNYRIDLEAFARGAGPDRAVESLTGEDFQRWIFAAPAPATHQTRRRMLKTFIRYLEEMDHVPAGFEKRLPPPFVTRLVISDYFTETEVEAICRAHIKNCEQEASKPKVPKSGPNSPLAKVWMTDAFWILFYQGLRRGELLAQRAGAVDLRRYMMHIGDQDFIPKGKDESLVTVTPPARPYFERLLEGLSRRDYVVRPTSRTKSARENLANRLSDAFKEALVSAVAAGDVPAEKEEMSLHNLRDSCCQYWIDRGVPERDVQELLRHKSVATTRRHYRSVNAQRQTEQFEAIYKRGNGVSG